MAGTEGVFVSADNAFSSARPILAAEIADQPQLLAQLFDRQRASVEQVAREIQRRADRPIVLVARGSSDNAAVYGRYLLEVCNHRLTSLASPSTVTLYGYGPRLKDSIVVAVSQSGQGEDVVAYLRNARAQGATTVAIVNNPVSPLAVEAEWVLECLAGPEISVPATKTVTAQMMLLALLSAALDTSAEALCALERIPEVVEQGLRLRSRAAEVAGILAPLTLASVVGRGFAFPVALEVALKLKEMASTRAEPFSAADFLHGPITLVEGGYAALVVDAGGHSSQPAAKIVEEVHRRGGQPFLLRAGEIGPAPGEIPTLQLHAPILEQYAPLVALVLGQLLAVEVGAARGLDPAHPRGLQKVTSTR